MSALITKTNALCVLALSEIKMYDHLPGYYDVFTDAASCTKCSHQLSAYRKEAGLCFKCEPIGCHTCPGKTDIPNSYSCTTCHNLAIGRQYPAGPAPTCKTCKKPQPYMNAGKKYCKPCGKIANRKQRAKAFVGLQPIKVKKSKIPWWNRPQKQAVRKVIVKC